MKEENTKKFIKELAALTRKYKIKIGGCGCCDSPYLSDLDDHEDPRAGYSIKDDGDLSWISPKNEYDWKNHRNTIVR